jgi:hypothetical protein
VTDVSLRRLAIWAGIGPLLLLAGCQSVVPRPAPVDRPVIELPVRPEPRTPDGPEAPDFDVVFATLPSPPSKLTGTELCIVRDPCPMPAGRYRSTEFAVPVAFTLPKGDWTNSANELDGIAITDGALGISFMSAAERMWYGPGRQTTWDPDLQQQWLSMHESLGVGPVQDGPAIDGRPTRFFDVENPLASDVVVLRKSAALGWRTAATYRLAPGATVRLTFIDVDGQTVVFALEAPTAAFDADLRRMRPVVDSIDFEDPPRVLSGTEPCATYPDPCPMDPGHYFSRQFHVAFDLPEGEWTNSINWPNALELRDGARSLTLLSGGYEACWYGASYRCGGWWKPPSIHSPADLRKHLERDSFLETTRIDRSTTLDGRPVQTFDVRNIDDSRWSELIYEIQSGSYWMASGHSVRLHFLEIDGEPVIVALEAPTTTFEADLRAMQPVLDSLQFEDQR